MGYRIALASGVFLSLLVAATFVCSRIGPGVGPGGEETARPEITSLAGILPLVILVIGAALIAVGVIGLRKKGTQRSYTDTDRSIDEPE